MIGSNPQLEALVREHDDEASWQVLEDWLLETDDPRARLVRLEKAGRDTAAAYAELQPLLLGEPEMRARSSRAGFAREASIRITPKTLPALEASLGRAPGLRLLRELTIEVTSAFSPAIVAIAAAPFASSLDALTVAYRGIDATLDAELLGPLLRLERLGLRGRTLSVIYGPPLATLRELELALTPGATASVLDAGHFPELRSLTVDTGTLLDAWHNVFGDLFAGTCAPRLDTLHLEAAPAPASVDFLRLLAPTPLAARLRTLSFAGTECSPDALRRLGRAITSVESVAL